MSPIRTGIGFSLKTKKQSQAVALHNTVSNMKWELGFCHIKVRYCGSITALAVRFPCAVSDIIVRIKYKIV